MDIVLTNAVVRTSDDALPLADTVVIRDGRIAFVGERGGWADAGELPVHDLGGRTVLPGFVDSHTHPSMVAQSLWHVRLPWTMDVQEILLFIRDYARAHPVEEAPFLYFEYYPSEMFRDFAPSKELLDTAVSDRPVLCQDFSEHAHWVNSKMLDLMGVTKDTPDPLPGLEVFARDDNGEPTGHLFEMAHVGFLPRMYEKIGWTPPEALTADRVAAFFRFMTEHGVTTLFEALVEDETIFDAITELERRGELNTYYEGSLRFRNSTDLPDAIARLQRCHAQYASEYIRLNTLKLFLDGTNESGTSALLAPLCSHVAGSNAGGLGEIGMETPELTECFLLANSESVDIHIHLVGDRAFRVACDAVEAAQQRVRDDGSEWGIQVTLAHCELVDPADMVRPARLGIILNWTTHWSGGYFGEASEEHLGAERWNRMYRFNEFVDSGALVAFSSDVVTAYELHRGNPFFGMQVAHTRIDPEFPLDESRFPERMRPGASARISRERLLRGYTIDGAVQLRLADKVGSITVGKVANLTVLSEDLLTADANRLREIHCDAVLFEGRLVAGALPAAVSAVPASSRL